MYSKLDSNLLRFFQYLTDQAQKIGISLGILINLFLIIHCMGLLTQIVYLYLEERSIVVIFLKAFPTLFIIAYLRWVIKKSKQRPVNLIILRILSFSFALITTFDFTLGVVLRMAYQHIHFLDAIMFVKSELIYVIAFLSFFFFLYFLSCNQKLILDDMKYIKK